MSIHILTALWKRPTITRICFEGIKRLRAYNDTHIEVTAAISEPEYEDLCKEYDIGYVYADNRPLGHKWHVGLQEALESDFDYLMLLGSDDLISNSLLDLYKPLMEEYYVFGIEDLYIYSAYHKEVKYFPGYDKVKMSIGAGRMIHRKVIEDCGNKLWKFGVNRGLDGACLQRIRANGYDEHVINAKGKAAVMDIKSLVNLNRYEHFKGEIVDKEEVFSYFSEKELNLIARLQ